MTLRALRVPPLVLVALALAAVYAAVLAIVHSPMFARAPDRIALAATFDLTVTATAVVWWLGVRRKAIRPWLAVVVLSWGVAMAKRFVPHAPLGALFVAGGALEVASLTWLAVRIRRVARATRAARAEGPIGALAHGLAAAHIPARVAAIMATELAVVYLAVTGWFRRPPAGAFAMRGTGWLPFAGAIGFLFVGETIASHLLLAMLSPIAAWIATASSAYAVLWIVADCHAIRLYPHAVVGATLHLRLGIRWRAAVPLADITAVTDIHAVPDGALSLALFEPSVLLTLRAPVEVRGLLGLRRHADRIALTIDDPAAIRAAIARGAPTPEGHGHTILPGS
ncbi:MAG TPA: hypothetical protein VFP84_07770 [Kofleriaceae bacterium]|nr:hypothetical protein [Kofleriaceae bacterium]